MSSPVRANESGVEMESVPPLMSVRTVRFMRTSGPADPAEAGHYVLGAGRAWSMRHRDRLFGRQTSRIPFRLSARHGNLYAMAPTKKDPAELQAQENEIHKALRAWYLIPGMQRELRNKENEAVQMVLEIFEKRKKAAKAAAAASGQ